MSDRQRPQGVRLGIGHEADALLSIWGEDAYAIACQRAKEASSVEMDSDWSHVADAVARRLGKRSSFLSHMFH
ncbi:MAG TPA: hypothetical protein VMI72_01965 [Roseiarcus sp.]|nr:hypothetical protein [Roseiarcus sp.]